MKNNKMETMIGATALMKALEKEGVKEVFGLPGGANLPMYDELYKSNIRHILVRHEQSAACLLYTSPSPRDRTSSRMPSSA